MSATRCRARSAPRSAHSGRAPPRWANKIRPPGTPNGPQVAALRRAPRPGSGSWRRRAMSPTTPRVRRGPRGG
eukprot:8335741-Alexandrium_andersonii.AAC.1